ncbi:hypothetical protein [Roseovarius sp. Pro17]|uniref:hypothetical protein n=1 Tax=Roseovarius sp. Pro17 TaxID=3108175 RepID=UPI002D796670|nr:hypothetical protein [Roseovarius sp. Pro17]
MVEFLYRELGAEGAGHDDETLARLRTDQMLRAVRVASGFGVRPRAQAVSGQLLGDDEPGGDGARVIDTSGAEAWEDLGKRRGGVKHERRC